MVRRDRHDDLPLMADINVTSLVDVAFTILLIFMIAAPALQGGIEVDVPEADIRPIEIQDQPLIISVRPDGTI